MTKVSAGLMCLAFAGSTASAGTISLNPVAGQEGGVTPGTTAVFDLLIVSSDLPEFDTVSLLMGTDADINSRWSFAYDSEFSTTFPPPPPVPKWGSFVYTSELNIGGNNFGVGWTVSLLVGQLSIDTSGMMVDESIDIMLSSTTEIDRIGFALSGLAFGGGAAEPVEGGGTLNIIPEPGTLVLLAALAPFAVRRRPPSIPPWEGGRLTARR